MSENISVQLLSNHLVNVKMEFAEKEEYLTSELKKSTMKQHKFAFENIRLNDEVIALQIELNQLKQQIGVKWRVEERNEWRALVEAIQNDRTRLEEQNSNLKYQLTDLQSKLSSSNIGCSNENSNYTNKTLTNTAITMTTTDSDVTSTTSGINVQVQQLLNQLTYEREEGSVRLRQVEEKWLEQVDGLRYRLNVELEKQWQQQRDEHLHQKNQGIANKIFSYYRSSDSHPTSKNMKVDSTVIDTTASSQAIDTTISARHEPVQRYLSSGKFKPGDVFLL